MLTSPFQFAMKMRLTLLTTKLSVFVFMVMVIGFRCRTTVSSVLITRVWITSTFSTGSVVQLVSGCVVKSIDTNNSSIS